MYIATPAHKVRSKLVRESTADADTSMVRLYKHSPEDVAFQLWSGKRYTMVTLLPHEARAIATALLAAADEVDA